MGLLCLVFHRGSQTPPNNPIKWRIVKETFLECLTHYSLPTAPSPPLFPFALIHANLPPGRVHDGHSASLLLPVTALNRQSHRCITRRFGLHAERKISASCRSFLCSSNVHRFATRKERKQAKRLKIYKLISLELHECSASSPKAFLPRLLIAELHPHEEVMRINAGGDGG